MDIDRLTSQTSFEMQETRCDCEEPMERLMARVFWTNKYK